MSYTVLKTIHVSAVALSGTLFVVRGIWRLGDSPRLQSRWVRIVPHLIDTILFASALSMAYLANLLPWQQPWLAAKLLALVVYIGLGSLALKRARSPAVRAGCWVSALSVFAYMVAVALYHDPWPFG